MVPATLKRPQRVPYVLRLCVKPSNLTEFQLSECGRWEDHGAPPDKPGSEPLAYNILGRFQAQIAFRDLTEIHEVWWSLCSGTFQVFKPRAAKALAKRLKPYVKDPALLAEWPFPDCL